MKILIIVLAKAAQERTFSDGKLYTRSKKEAMLRVLELFVAFGASPDILIEAHPHIGNQ
jgi:uncharacterized FAD-dependent dehydrogenase